MKIPKPRTFSFAMIKGKRVKVTYHSGYVITGVPVQDYAGWFTMTDVKQEGKEGWNIPDVSVKLRNVKTITFIK